MRNRQIRSSFQGKHYKGHKMASQEEMLCLLSLTSVFVSKSASSNRSLDILWFWNQKVYLKWNLLGASSFKCITISSLHGYPQTISKSSFPKSGLLRPAYFETSLETNAYSTLKTWPEVTPGAESDRHFDQNPCHGHIPLTTETTGTACLSDPLACLFMQYFERGDK